MKAKKILNFKKKQNKTYLVIGSGVEGHFFRYGSYFDFPQCDKITFETASLHLMDIAHHSFYNWFQ